MVPVQRNALVAILTLLLQTDARTVCCGDPDCFGYNYHRRQQRGNEAPSITCPGNWQGTWAGASCQHCDSEFVDKCLQECEDEMYVMYEISSAEELVLLRSGKNYNSEHSH
eukprot:TRINITY_DN77062_c0_g1_i1.p2 TRINITY_DN77062_c0_g1~~TRINITY_DN77062_c0_g1_i1.p2  ORF type:complete len:111 (-),score=15.78 TRINITY_DN77062_c0_g1_i1:79-411(-)